MFVYEALCAVPVETRRVVADTRQVHRRCTQQHNDQLLLLLNSLLHKLLKVTLSTQPGLRHVQVPGQPYRNLHKLLKAYQ